MPFAKRLGLPFVANSMKPLPFGYRRALRILSLPKKNLAVVGDQLFTDVLGAHLAGIRAILVDPVDEGGGAMLRFRRIFEKRIMEKYPRKGGGQD